MDEQISAEQAEIYAMVELGFLPPAMDAYRRFSTSGDAIFIIKGKRSKLINKWRAEFINKHGVVKFRLSWFDSATEAAEAAFEKWLS